MHVVGHQHIVRLGELRLEQRVRAGMLDRLKGDFRIVAEELSERVMLKIVSAGYNQHADFASGVLGRFLPQKDVQVVAVCDVKTDQLELARVQVNKQYQNQDCATYGDFRELVARKDIDAFLVATPDHWHVLAALAAIRAGKDVYLE